MVMKNEEKTAVVLLSGGMDSSTVLAIAKEEGYDCHTLAFDYGQRHRLELAMAERQARSFGVADHRVIRIDLRLLGGSALTDENIAIPAGELASGIPATYVPARNAIFLSLGLAFAEVLGACEIFIGVNQVDFSGYPDCREGFLLAFEKMANMATRAGAEGGTVRVRAPLLHLGKAEIIRRGIELGVDFGNTHTCYDPDPEGRACGSCPSCRLRLRGFAEAGVPDPITYRR